MQAQQHHPSLSSDRISRRQPGHAALDMASRSASFDRRTRSDDSWVEVSSQPSSSSLSSINDEIATTGLRVQHDPRAKRRRTFRASAPPRLHIAHPPLSNDGTSSQEEYEESESESDHIMTSSGEGPQLNVHTLRHGGSSAGQSPASESAQHTEDDDDENRTAINYPIHNDTCFTPQPNAFSHPPASGSMRNASAPVPGSYFPSQRALARPASRQTVVTPQDRPSHLPQNILAPSYSAAAQHDEALRASLSTLLSCAAAARNKRPQAGGSAAQTRPNRVDPVSFRVVPESALPVTTPPQFQEPTFQPTLRRTSTSTSAASSEREKEKKRKAAVAARSASRERRALKKARRSTSVEELYVSPTLLTWVVSAGVVVILSALSFSAGYSLGREAGRLEAGGLAADEQVRSCAREASRTSLGLKRSLARSAVQV